jgi:uncharacterized protein (TIGR03435 family)
LSAACEVIVITLLCASASFSYARIASQNPPQTLAATPTAPQSTATALDKGASVPLPSFEVVSIKPNKSDSITIGVWLTPDGIKVNGLTVHMLLREALGITDPQLVGEPRWVNSERFDVEAKAAADDAPTVRALSIRERWAMLLPVFEDRFGLKFHSETKDITQYVLVVAKGGLKMKEATTNETNPDGKPGGGGIRSVGQGEFVAEAVEIGSLVRFLSFQFHGPVLDKTGLTGKYDIDLNWTPDESEEMMRQLDAAPGAENPPPPTTGPSIFTALEEQLGLKLEAHKEPGEVIVIDHIEQPSAN